MKPSLPSATISPEIPKDTKVINSNRLELLPNRSNTAVTNLTDITTVVRASVSYMIREVRIVEVDRRLRGRLSAGMLARFV